MMFLETARENKVSVKKAIQEVVNAVELGDSRFDELAICRLIVERRVLTTSDVNYFYIEDESLMGIFESSEIKSGFVKPVSVIDRLGVAESKDSKLLDTETLEFMSGKSITFVLNHKSDKFHSLIIELTELKEGDSYGVNITEGENTITTRFNDGEKVKLYKNSDIGTENGWADSVLKVFSNFMLYLCAFPEKVIDGVPNDFRINKMATVLGGKRFHLKTSDKMIDKSSPIPHIRSGHFRRLESDYYKNKKGQVVWIESTMVKGKAKTVLN